MRTPLALLILVAAACGSKKDAAKEDDSKPFAGPMPITFGACAATTVAFVSGPRPLPPPAIVPTADPTTAGAEDPALARQQAIEAARAAGILGSTAPPAATTGADDDNIYGGLLGNEVGEMSGGFGIRGSSDTNTTGWGTIGAGRYGTIGHGNPTGTGYGYGVGGSRGRARNGALHLPTVSIGQPTANGDLDKAIIRRYIKRNLTKIQYCYEKVLLAKPSIEGTLAVQFFIAPSGSVAQASASGVDREVASCVAGVIKDIEFPKPKGGGGVQVNYPFTFRPGGSPPSRPVAVADTGSGSGSAPTSPPVVAGRAMHRGFGDVPAYTRDNENPLSLATDSLETCFRKTATHRGAIVVDLAYDPSGAVSGATVVGLADAAATACVVAAALHVRAPDVAVRAQRCAVAFGETPTAELEGIDLGATVKLAGKDLGATTSSTRELPALRAAIEARVTAATATTGPELVVHPPLVLRAEATTPLASLMRVMLSVVHGGDDVVLAARRGTTWTLLSDLKAPVVPVPFGTGATWHPLKTARRPWDAVDEDRAMLSLLVGKDKHIRVGVSRVQEFKDIPATELAAELKDQRASAFFADRDDLEIAGDDDLTYGDLLPVIDTAIAAGFTNWRITSPDSLAARPR